MEQPNLDYVNELAAGDEAFKNKLLAVVKEELPQEMQLYFENYNNSAFAKAAENVHKLKHKLGILGIVQGYQTAIDYEAELNQGKSTLKNEFDNLLRRCESFVNDL